MADQGRELRLQETTRGIARGWHYTPLRQGKRPYLAGWPGRRESAQQYLDWAERGNVGVICGEASGASVIDIEADALHRVDEFPLTPTAITGGGGRHLYYQHPADDRVRNWVGEIGERLDIRTTGGQVVAVGSVHPDTGAVYTWAPGLSPDDVPLAPFPVDQVLALYEAEQARKTATKAAAAPAPKTAAKPRQAGQHAARDRYVANAVAAEVERVRTAPEGQGNATVNAAAYNLGQLVGQGLLSESEATEAVISATHGWTARDGNDGAMRRSIETTVRSGISAGRANPRRRQIRAEEQHTQNLPAEAFGDVQTVIDTPDGPAPAPAAPPVNAPANGKPHPAGVSVDSAASSGYPYPEGSIHPTLKRVILNPRQTRPTARAFLREFYRHKQFRRLVYHGGGFFEWSRRRNCWREIELPALENRLSRWLARAITYKCVAGEMRPRRFESNPRAVADTLRTLQGVAHLPAKVSTPAWLREEAPFPVGELLPFRTSTLHIPTGTLLEATPRLFVQSALEFDYDPAAQQPTQWLDFLGRAFDHDPQQIDLLQEWFGYCLTSDNRYHKMFLLIGPPRSGKGTIERILERLVGSSNVCNPSVQDLAEPIGFWSMIGKLLAAFTDARWTTRDAAPAVDKLLRISGGDAVNVRRMYQSSLTNVHLTVRMMMLSNEMPSFFDASGAMAHRFLIARTMESYIGREDLDLEQRICSTELPGILLWAIEGWKRLNTQRKFTVTDVMRRELEDLMESSSPVQKFAREYCDVGPAYRCNTSTLWSAWQRWCKAENRDWVGTQSSFGRDLRAAFHQVKRTHSRDEYLYAGIRVRPEHWTEAERAGEMDPQPETEPPLPDPNVGLF